MQGKTINVGLIGLGRMGQVHAHGFHKMPLVNLKAVCDTNEDQLAETCKKYDAKGYKDYNEMLADKSIDAISICLPDNMHYDCIIKATAAGKHILCEKPLVNNLPEALEIEKHLQNYDKVFMVAYCLRYDGPRIAVRDRYIAGDFGEIIYIYNRRNSPIVGPMHYAGFSDIADHVMIHDIDYINWLFGSKPGKVYAKSRSVLLKEKNMTDVIFALLTYPNGTLVCLESCWAMPDLTPMALDDRMELIGTKGSAYLDCSEAGTMFVLDRDAPKPVRNGGDFYATEATGLVFEELIDFIRCVAGEKTNKISIREAVEGIEVVEAINLSIKEDREIIL